MGAITINDNINTTKNIHPENNPIENAVPYYTKAYNVGPPSISYHFNNVNTINNLIMNKELNVNKDNQLAKGSTNDNPNKMMKTTQGDRFIFRKKKALIDKEISSLHNFQELPLPLPPPNKHYFDKTLPSFDNQSNSPLKYERYIPSPKKRPYIIKKPDPIFNDLKMDVASPFRIEELPSRISVKSVNDANDIYFEPENNAPSIEISPKIPYYQQIQEKSNEIHIPKLRRLNYLKKINLDKLIVNKEYNTTEIDEIEQNTLMNINQSFNNELDYDLKEVIQKSINDIRNTMNSKMKEHLSQSNKAPMNVTLKQLSSPTVSKIKEIKSTGSIDYPEQTSPSNHTLTPSLSSKMNRNLVDKFYTSHLDSSKNRPQTIDQLSNSFELSNIKKTEINMHRVRRSDDLTKELKYAVQNKYIGKKQPTNILRQESPWGNITESNNQNSVFNGKNSSFQSINFLSISGQGQVTAKDFKKFSPQSRMSPVGPNVNNNVNNISHILANGPEKPSNSIYYIKSMAKPINQLVKIKNEKDVIMHKYNKLSPNKVPNLIHENKFVTQLPDPATIRHRVYNTVSFFHKNFQ